MISFSFKQVISLLRDSTRQIHRAITMITRLRVLRRRLRKATLSLPRRFHSSNTTRSLADIRIVIKSGGMGNRFRRIVIIRRATMTTRADIDRRTRKLSTIGKRRKRVNTMTWTSHVTTKDGRRRGKRRGMRMRLLNITIKISTGNRRRRIKRNYRNKVSVFLCPYSFFFFYINELITGLYNKLYNSRSKTRVVERREECLRGRRSFERRKPKEFQVSQRFTGCRTI